ncbi:hypothetical protein HOD38_02240 [archaeon]|jgi:hypothetical protein|nr:hypothetical protein [archaeon]MBT4397061.1 hypothetical protein [archaeon]MBT4441047.1 hypothetical protein [archaeon]
MKLSKRGSSEPTSNFTVGLIIGVTLIIILGGIGLKFYMNSKAMHDSFNGFTEELAQLNNGETSHEVLAIPEGYTLVSFQGSDFDAKCEEGNYDMKMPDSCGMYPCLCFCKIGYAGFLNNDDCKKRGECYAFTEQDYTPTLRYPECPEGVFIETPPGNLFELYFKREGDTLYISQTAEFISDTHKDAITSLISLSNNLTTCTSKEEDCKCDVDLNLEIPYSFYFEENEITLFNGTDEVHYEAINFEFGYDDKSEFYVLNAAEDTPLLITEATLASIIFNTDASDAIEINSYVEKRGDKFYFIAATETSTLTNCRSTEITL